MRRRTAAHLEIALAAADTSPGADKPRHILAAQIGALFSVFIAHADIRFSAMRRHRRLILRVDSVFQHIQRNRAVHRACIQMQNM